MDHDRRFVHGWPRTTVPGLQLVMVKRPARLNELSPAERAQHDQLATVQRQVAWRRGRAALKTLLHRLGEPLDTTRLSFPHPRLSLTHSGTHAVAVGVAHNLPLMGIGVDLEIQHTVLPEAARFFLTEEEQRWLARLAAGSRARELLRLWTIKEAVFKADVQNAGRLLADYQLAAPEARNGIALLTAAKDRRAFCYTSRTFKQGFLALAVRREKEGMPWPRN